MNKIVFPELLSIEVVDFTLYKKQQSFKYDFIKGVNLIIGGNGLGKTSFVNMIRYALIGLYEKEYGFTRTYKGREIERRKQLPEKYFANRMDSNDVVVNRASHVILVFQIGNKVFTVKRGLYEIALLEVVFYDKSLKVLGEKVVGGKVISQYRYEKLQDNERPHYLQFNYESLVSRECGLLNFDSLIFFTNEILFFGENHKTILWSDDYEKIQLTLTSKYFADPKVEEMREDALRKEKYYDSLSRHKSEDMRVLKNLLKELTPSDDKEKVAAQAVEQIEIIKSSINKFNIALDETYQLREAKLREVSVLNKVISEADFRKQGVENLIKKHQADVSNTLFVKPNPKYSTYSNNILRNDLCPMCNQEATSELKSAAAMHNSDCFLCHLPLPHGAEKPEDSKKLIADLEDIVSIIGNAQLQIVALEELIAVQDKEYNKLSEKIFKERNKLRAFEHKTNKSTDTEAATDIDVIRAKLSALDEDKENYAKKSREMRGKALKYAESIEEENLKINNELSNYFSQYASNFLGLDSYLAFDDYGDGKKFVPIINGKERLSSEELSESQRFFVDHSFRMSLLSLFYQSPAFFICETPDSSLDISYEQKAAEVFLTYLKNPNVLIITSNLNNSEFLEYLIDKSNNVKVLNLFEYGKLSPVQQESDTLAKAISKIKNKIKGKSK